MKHLIFILILSLPILMTAQDNGNLVPNPYLNGSKPKKAGQIAKATGWFSPTEDQADLFYENGKGDFGGTNMYGAQTCEDGSHYAGIRVWSYKDKDPLTYIGTELSAAMEEGKIYCISFSVSLADLSKYAANNIGLYVSNQMPDEKMVLSSSTKPQIIHSRNIIYDDMDMFTKVCKTYTAEGGEKYLVIGNFSSDDTKTKKVKRPRGFTTPQMNMSYYYVTDVSVIPMDSLDECSCEKLPEGVQNMEIVYEKSISGDAKLKVRQRVELKKVYFPDRKSVLPEDAKTDLDEIAQIMLENDYMKLLITGNTDAIEQLKSDTGLSEKRAKVVYDYLVGKGVPESRLSFEGVKDSNPLAKEETPEARSKNKRVDFKLH